MYFDHGRIEGKRRKRERERERERETKLRGIICSKNDAKDNFSAENRTEIETATATILHVKNPLPAKRQTKPNKNRAGNAP
jgi:hypothetical protein